MKETLKSAVYERVSNDLEYIIDAQNKKIKSLEDVIEGYKVLHETIKKEIFNLREVKGSNQNLEITLKQHKNLITELHIDNKRLSAQIEDQLNQFRNKGGL